MVLPEEPLPTVEEGQAEAQFGVTVLWIHVEPKRGQA